MVGEVSLTGPRAPSSVTFGGHCQNWADEEREALEVRLGMSPSSVYRENLGVGAGDATVQPPVYAHKFSSLSVSHLCAELLTGLPTTGSEMPLLVQWPLALKDTWLPVLAAGVKGGTLR